MEFVVSSTVFSVGGEALMSPCLKIDAMDKGLDDYE